MEWPKRARTADWENGVLTLDREKKFETPELTAEIMERLARYTLVGFHVKGCPVTDELLAPFAGHKSMVNFGVEDGALTDACFPVFSAMPKLRYLLLDGNAAIHGSGLPALQGCKLDLLTLNRTGLDDAGLVAFMERDMAVREPFYAQAHLVVDCDAMSDDQVVEHILRQLGLK